MAVWSEMNSGTKTAVGVVVLILFGGGGYELWKSAQPAGGTVEAVAPAANIPAAPAADVAAAAPAAVAEATAAAAADATVAPAADATVAADATAAPAIDATVAADATLAPAEDATAAPAADATAAPAADATAAPAADASAAPAADATVAPAEDATAAPAADATVAPAADATVAPAADATVAPAADATVAPVANAPAAPAADAAAAPTAATAAAPAADAATAPAADATMAAVAPAQAQVQPSLDLVRIEPDGTALVAGQAPAGSAVSLLANGVEVAQTKADPKDKFVAMFTLPATASGQMLSMTVTLPDGTVIASPSLVAIATIAAPAPVMTADAAATVDPVAPAPADQPASVDAGPVATTKAPATPEAPAVGTTTALAVTETGVKVLQSGTVAPAEVLANVSLDIIAYPSPEKVQFGGRGTAGQFVRLYLNNIALGDATLIATDGAWSETVEGIAPKIYNLRVDQIDANGKVTSRFETPFKRETPEALAAASGVVAAATKVAEATPKADSTTTQGTTSGTDAATPAAGDGTTTAEVAAPVPAAPVPAAPVPAAPVTVTVQPGFTLWYIAKQNFGEGVLYVQVFEANRDKIKNPDLIYPGQIFTIPAKP